jgi:hypothetical protein
MGPVLPKMFKGYFRKYRSHAGLKDDFIQVLPVSKPERRDVEKDHEFLLINHGVHHIETLVWFMVFNATFNNISVMID